MRTYVIRRMLLFFPTLIGVSLIVLMLLHICGVSFWRYARARRFQLISLNEVKVRL